MITRGLIYIIYIYIYIYIIDGASGTNYDMVEEACN